VIEWVMVLAGGLLGSSHCIGMCGGFALALASNRHGLGRNLLRQVVYSLGRVFTYTVFGAAAGYAGWRLANELHLLVNVQAILCVAAGLLLVVQGLAAAGVLRRLPGFSGNGPCLGSTFFASLLGATRLHSVFLGGVVNGLLPCGLVYAYVALAASSGDLMRGGVTMTLFGLGTLPVMALVGCGGQVLSAAARQHVFRIAAWCVVLTGIVSVVRGLGFLPLFGGPAEPGCPMCFSG
jgi:hypothetical protein